MTEPAPDLERAFRRLVAWIDDHGTAGYDVCDVGGHPLFLGFERLKRRGGRLGRVGGLARGAGLRLPHPVWRRLLRIGPSTFPQAMGNLAAAWSRAGERVEESERRARECLDWLRDHPSPPHAGLAWGQPYDWVSTLIIPRDTPRATVTSIVGHAFLDAYERWGRPEDLEAADGACEFMLRGLHRTVDDDGDFCFSYTSIDRYCVHNASMVAAGLLARTWKHTGRDELREAALAATRYTVKHQMESGAWDYRGPPDAPAHVIDNYHSGFVVEALAIVHRALGRASSFGPALERGLAFYRDELFTPEGLPKTLPQRPYPVNVQSAAQAMITFALLSEDDPTLLSDALRIARWTTSRLQAGDGHFGYKVFQDGKVDMTPYIRWTESWMARAFACLLPALDAHPEAARA